MYAIYEMGDASADDDRRRGRYGIAGDVVRAGEIGVAGTDPRASFSGMGDPLIALSVNRGLAAAGLLTADEERERGRYGRGAGLVAVCGLVGDSMLVGESIFSASFGVEGEFGSGGSSIPNSSVLRARGGGLCTSASKS